MSRTNPVEEVRLWWQIVHDRIPQLQEIAEKNNLNAAQLLNYEALYHLMYQWYSPMTKPWTRLDAETIATNEIARISLAKHANLFIRNQIIDPSIRADIQEILPPTQFAWKSQEALAKARISINKVQESAQSKYQNSALFQDSKEYCDMKHADTINTAWNLYLLTTYRINNFLITPPPISSDTL